MMGTVVSFPARAAAKAPPPPLPVAFEEQPFKPTHRFRTLLVEYVCSAHDCTDSRDETITFRSPDKRLWSCPRALFEGRDAKGSPNFTALVHMKV